jgi:AcrR family transcriptional regulator
MDKRQEAVEETRRRIVDTTVALHGEQGVLGTSWEDIAKKADVALATVYRHFPSLDELVPACGQQVVGIMKPPTLEATRELFAAASSLADRIKLLAKSQQ